MCDCKHLLFQIVNEIYILILTCTKLYTFVPWGDYKLPDTFGKITHLCALNYDGIPTVVYILLLQFLNYVSSMQFS